MVTRGNCFGVMTAALLIAGTALHASADADHADTALTTQAQIASRAARPVLVVAGMMEDEATIAPLVKVLRGRGFDVSTWVPANLGLNDINVYAGELGKKVAEVVARTGAEKLDLIGHSQGGVTARRYVQLAGEDVPVHTLISMGSPQQGTDYGALASGLASAGLFDWAPGAKQLVVGSDFLSELNQKNDPTPGEVRYVAIGTRQDQVTKPVALSGIPGGENLDMQAICPRRNVGHFGLLSDGWVHQVIFSVLAGGDAKGDCGARPLGGTS
ncbi:MAG: alpha/beta fold hydrolase [Polyangiales bacterium]